MRKEEILQNHSLLHLNTTLHEVCHPSLRFFPVPCQLPQLPPGRVEESCLSSSWPQCWDSQYRVMAISMVVLWCIHFPPAVITRKEPLAEGFFASFKLYICSHLSVHTTWDATSLSSCAGICLLVLFVLEVLWLRRLTSKSLWMKMYSINKRIRGVQPSLPALNSSPADNESSNKPSHGP